MTENVRTVEQISVPDVPDAALVERALAGDRWAQEAIYRRHVPAVHATVVRLMRSREGVEDIVQDAFADALAELPRLRNPAALRPWLLSIAVHRLHAFFRRRALLRVLGLAGAVEPVSLEGLASSAASPEVRAELALVDRGLSRMPQRERTAWMLRHVEGEELADVAQILGCSLATVKRRIAAAELLMERHLRSGGER